MFQIAASSEKHQNHNVRMINKNDFKFMSLIGSGSYGNVFLVEKIHGIDAGRLYAMKVIDKERVTHKDNMKNCANMERKILIQLADCPYVVHLYYAFQTEKKLYLAMDFAQGGELNSLISKNSRLSEEKTKIIAAEVITAFEKIQDMNIVYRDFKMENILLDNEGHILIADFGLGKVLKPKSRTYTVCGTLEYMAPEMYDKKGHDLRSDWHSIGAVLVEVLQGFGPYQHLVDENSYESVKRIISHPPRLPNFIRKETTNFLVQLLRKDPSKRLTNIAEIKKHPFFHGIDWEAVKNKNHESFITPELESPDDLSQFCTTFTTQSVEHFIDDSNPIDPDDDENFKGYYYVAPSLIEFDFHPHQEELFESPIIPFSEVLTQGKTSTQIADSHGFDNHHDDIQSSRQTDFNFILNLYGPLFHRDCPHLANNSSTDTESSTNPIDSNNQKTDTSDESDSETSSDESDSETSSDKSMTMAPKVINKPVDNKVSKFYINKRRLPVDEKTDSKNQKTETSNETDSEASSNESMMMAPKVINKPVDNKVQKFYISKRRFAIDETTDSKNQKMETSNESDSETSSDKSMTMAPKVINKPVDNKVPKLYINKRRLPVDETTDESHVSKMVKMDKTKKGSSNAARLQIEPPPNQIDVLAILAEYAAQAEKFRLILANDSFCKFTSKSPTEAIVYIKKNYVDNKRKKSWIQVRVNTLQGA